MCGINGIVSLSGESQRVDGVVQDMNSRIKHRGPDNSGIFSQGSVTLGHVRLSIIDLSENGNQPFTKGNFTIVFNGEIYNYKELIEKYGEGIDWHSKSDTEVVLEMWQKFGTSSILQLRGMFCFAIYDHNKDETYIVRDHFGIKPLFYCINDDKLIFSSELKALEQPNTSYDVDYEAIAASMLYCWIPENLCMYQNVNKLQPGTFLHISQNNVEIKQYWSTKSVLAKMPSIKTESEAIDKLSNVLEESVKAHMVADVPVSAFLSGGLDSSLIVSMASKLNKDLDCYTIKFAEDDNKIQAMADDCYYARKVADNFGVKLHEIEVKPNLVELLPKIVEHLDEPIGDSAAINTYLICEEAKQRGVKVLLSGMGADEMFAGYRKHVANVYAERYRKTPEIIRSAASKGVDMLPLSIWGRGFKLGRWAKRFMSFANKPEPEAFLGSYTYYELLELEKAVYQIDDDFSKKVKDFHQEMFCYGLQNRDLVDAMCFTDINHFMVSLNLAYSDRASMAASTEVRVPFVDIKVIEEAFKVCSSLKIKGNEQKYILKKVAEKWLPNEIIYRPKSSFTMPLRSWISGELKDVVDDYLLSPSGLSNRKIINPIFLKKLIDEERKGIADNAQKIWHLLTLEQWFRNKGI